LSWNYIKELIEVPDAELTQEGKEIKDLAIRMDRTPEYLMTETDKNIYDQRWRKLYK
jgi:hypothetical protein|tara:strand:+ start:6282 stop:6452 length:171 start_codon:yes stop_codon:yes gene_type:complete